MKTELDDLHKTSADTDIAIAATAAADRPPIPAATKARHGSVSAWAQKLHQDLYTECSLPTNMSSYKHANMETCCLHATFNILPSGK